MHDVGMNMSQLAMSVKQVDDTIELAHEWSHQLLHATENFDMERIGAKLEAAMAALHEAHDALEGYEEAIEADEPTANASAFLISPDGLAVTNYHSIDGAISGRATLITGEACAIERVIYYDADIDLAVIRIARTTAEGETVPCFHAIALAGAKEVRMGDTVYALGYPGGGAATVTTGKVTDPENDDYLAPMIESTAQVISGNSGGALFNLYGEVIGITNAKYSSSGSSGEASIDNIGFAIPLDQVRSIFESIITNGYIVKPYIGVTVSDVSAESQSYGLPQGAAVRSVTENGPAAEAGLQENDIITAANGETITSSNDLVKLVKAASAGDTLELTVYRQGQTLTLTLTVGEQKTDALPAQTTDQTQQSQQGYYDGGQSGQSDNQFGGSWPFGFGFGG